MKKQVLLVCGTRPEIIKMAPVYAALKESKLLEPSLLHTGQHTDLAAPLYKFFGMPPTESLALHRQNSSLSALSVALLAPISDAITRLRPSAVLVHGDTSSSIMAALAAFYEKIPVGHVEAGLRTNDRYSPFPEEMNRCLTGRLAHWHYAPTQLAAKALLSEGINSASICITGNTVVDAAKQTAALLNTQALDPFITDNSIAERISGRRLVLVTAHRRENWGAGLAEVSAAIAQLLRTEPDLFVVWPLHANPDVARTVREAFSGSDVDRSRLVLAPPLDYPALIWLLHKAWVVLTDSGGIQEEAAAFGVPVLVLRDSTERPELIEAGGGVLVGAVAERICAQVFRLGTEPDYFLSMRNIVNPFGNGTAGIQVVNHLETVLCGAN